MIVSNIFKIKFEFRQCYRLIYMSCLRRSKSEPLAGVIVIHPWRFWWVGF